MTAIRSMDEYRNRYFPATVEAERIAKLTPEELGREWAMAALDRFSAALAGEGTP